MFDFITRWDKIRTGVITTHYSFFFVLKQSKWHYKVEQELQSGPGITKWGNYYKARQRNLLGDWQLFTGNSYEVELLLQ